MPSIIANDGSISIMAVTLLSESAIPDTIEGLRDSYADYAQYSESTLKLGGYDATCITYYDEFFGYNAEYVVDFAQDYKGFFGVKLVVSSLDSMDTVLSDAVLAILNTVRLA